ncbi:retrovirus-related pol polyprotein from transposon TNT 1-94 [Tanacetum coccineum]
MSFAAAKSSSGSRPFLGVVRRLATQDTNFLISRNADLLQRLCSLKSSFVWRVHQSSDYELEQLDVKTAFLHGNLEEVIYMRQPPGYEQDDILIACKSKAEIGSTKSLLKKEFDMKELGEAKKILGMKIVRDRSRKIMRVSQSGKVPYANAIRSLMYLMVCTRPDIAYAVSVVSRYLANPGKNHWEAVKWNLKYLRGTANMGLVYGTDRGNHVDITGFVDSDYAKDPDKGRSITGYVFLVRGCVVSWKATLQHVVTLSTTETEYMALTEAMKEAIWLRGLLEELGVEILEAKTVEVLNVDTEHNVADALTKVVPGLNQSLAVVCLQLQGRGSASINLGCRVSNPTVVKMFWYNIGCLLGAVYQTSVIFIHRTSVVSRQCTSSDGDSAALCLLRRLATPDWLALAS